ncbi:melatonin receptor type 1B-B-like [Amphiura filiformis]|uniref:melatonin receptor type 1B-B-like n=1 Tax=Amphiura filiformis TaxID=82378 RepID=UPI003B20F996
MGDTNGTKLSYHIIASSKEDALLLNVLGIYRVFISFTGSTGNALVILAVLTTRKLRTPANIFVLSLAFADTCITSLVEPVYAYATLIDRELYSKSPGLCTAIGSMCFISCTCSLWNIGAIAINRYVFICKQQYYKTIFTWRKTIAYAVTIWIICILADFSNFFGWGGHSFDPKFVGCSYDRLASFSHVLFTVIVFVSMPMVLIVVCYAAIFWTLRQSSLRVRQAASSSEKKRPERDIKLLKMLFTIFVTFAFCWTLYTLLLVIDYDDNIPDHAYRLAAVLSHTNSSLNSIIYGVMNKNFRDAYRKILSCGKWKPYQIEAELSMNTKNTNIER